MKRLAVIASLILITLASYLAPGDVNVEIEMPEKVVAGDSFVMDIKIDKGDISNFSKLVINLPAGFSAELIDGKGATFTYYQSKVKLIWLPLPPDPVFIVKLKITVAQGKEGAFEFSGNMDYVVVADREKVEFSSSQLFVEAQANGAAPGTTATALGGQQNVDATVSVERSLEADAIAPGESFLVEMEVNKGSLTGFFKITESLPPGFTASEVESNGAIFTVSGNTVKFLWMTVPSDENFMVSYKVSVDPNMQGSKVIEGKCSYIIGEDQQTKVISNSSIQVTNNPSEISDPVPTTTEPVVKNDPVVTTQPVNTTEPVTKPDPIVKPDPITKPDPIVETTPEKDPEAPKTNNVTYSVQICATKKPVDPQYFEKNHNITEKVNVQMHEGWHKFTVGKFTVYMEASTHRVFIRENKKIVGPFVTAYNSGERITVQEALMITNDTHVDPTTF